jgi:hypothetical protein
MCIDITTFFYKILKFNLLISWDSFVNSVNAYKASQRELDIWVGENHYTPQGNYLAIKLNDKIKFQNFIKET